MKKPFSHDEIEFIRFLKNESANDVRNYALRLTGLFL